MAVSRLQLKEPIRRLFALDLPKQLDPVERRWPTDTIKDPDCRSYDQRHDMEA